MIARGRVLKQAEAASLRPLAASAPSQPTSPGGLPFGRVAPPALVDAHLEAARVIAEARREAAQLLDAARRAVGDLHLRAEAEARAEASAKLAAHALALATHESKSDERALERSVALARVLAERLLGASLSLAPEQVVALARQALAEARGARRLTIAAHPEDAQLLMQHAPSLGVALETLRIVPDVSRTRGSLRIETDVGILDADLAPQLDRLALRLRETLSHGS